MRNSDRMKSLLSSDESNAISAEESARILQRLGRDRDAPALRENIRRIGSLKHARVIPFPCIHSFLRTPVCSWDTVYKALAHPAMSSECTLVLRHNDNMHRAEKYLRGPHVFVSLRAAVMEEAKASMVPGRFPHTG